MTNYGVGDEGLEPLQQSNGKTTERGQGDVKGDAVTLGSDLLEASDDGILDDNSDGLALIVEAWSKLSADAQRAIVEFVERQLDALTAANDDRPAGSN